METHFGQEQWTAEEWMQAHTFRYPQLPKGQQQADCLASAANAEHPEKYDNFAMFSRETYRAGVSAEIDCAFEGAGCPEIVLTDDLVQDEDGAMRYGACFEIVLYRGGINIWRHYRTNGQCTWHKRVGVKLPVETQNQHTLRVAVRENYLDVAVDDWAFTLRADDLPEQFHLGACLCEGVARLYGMRIQPA